MFVCTTTCAVVLLYMPYAKKARGFVMRLLK